MEDRYSTNQRTIESLKSYIKWKPPNILNLVYLSYKLKTSNMEHYSFSFFSRKQNTILCHGRSKIDWICWINSIQLLTTRCYHGKFWMSRYRSDASRALTNKASHQFSWKQGNRLPSSQHQELVLNISNPESLESPGANSSLIEANY